MRIGSPTPEFNACPAHPRTVLRTLVAALCGLIIGAGLDVSASLLEQYGPQIGPFAFNGNGSIVIPFCVAPLALAVGTVILGIRRAYWPMAGFVVGFIVAVGGYFGSNISISTIRHFGLM